MDAEHVRIIVTLSVVFASAIGGGLVARKAGLPLLLGYIFLGIVAGNIVSHFIDVSFVTLIGEIGVVLLLFTLGIEFSFLRLKTILRTIAVPAAIQVGLSIAVFTAIGVLFGFSVQVALFLAAAGSLSSTAVVMKILTEKGKLGTNSAHVLTGWLVVQDLAVLPIMILLPIITTQGGGGWIVSAVAWGVFRSVMIIAAVVVLGRYFIPKILDRVSRVRSREIFLLSAVAIVFLSALFSVAAGLSAALGAFIAGLVIAETSQNHEIFSEIRPLRDVFAVLFFVSIGLLIPVSAIISYGALLVPFLCVMFFVKGLLGYTFTRAVGYHRKTAFSVSMGLLSMSEFGFVIAHEGMRIGVLTHEQYTLLVIMTFGSLFVSAPLLTHSERLFYRLNKTLGRFWPKIFPYSLHTIPAQGLRLERHVVVCGYGRVGRYIGRALEMSSIPFVVIDYNPPAYKELRDRQIPVVSGDPADRDILRIARVGEASYIVIAIPDRFTQEMIISNALTLNKHIRIISRIHFEEDQKRLKSMGVHVVVQPEFEASLAIVRRLLPAYTISREDAKGKISRLKIEHGLG